LNSDSIVELIQFREVYSSDSFKPDEYHSILQENVIKIITILFSVFTAIFGIFTFLTQSNLNRAEKLKDDFFVHIESIKTHTDNKELGFEAISDGIQKRSEDLLNKASNLLNKSEENNKRHTDLWFLIANQFFPTRKQPSITNMKDIVDLWDPGRVKYAVQYLSARGDKTCLLFLRNRYAYYKSSDDANKRSIAQDLKEAIIVIEKREKSFFRNLF